MHAVPIAVVSMFMGQHKPISGLSIFSVYYRGDPRENEAVLREALPVLHLSFGSSLAEGS